MSTQLIKEYKLKDIESRLSDYKLLKIEDLNGVAICPYNKYAKPIKEHYKDCIKRFNSEIVPDGYYYFCLSQSIYRSKTPDKFLILKGQSLEEGVKQNIFNSMNGTQNKNELITIQAALGYITEISNLKVQVATLEAEVKRLKDENAVLEAELEEMERAEDSNGLSQGAAQSNTMDYIKETAPTLIALADRYFSLQDKKLNLEQEKINRGIYEPKKRTIVKTFEPGSDEHLNLIKKYHAEGNEAAMDKELDKLEKANPEKYTQICTDLNLFEDENDNEQ